MCFRPADINTIEHRCESCGTNNLPEATMCANCFAPMEPLTEEDIAKQRAAQDQAAAGAPAPAAPSAPTASTSPAAPPNPFTSSGPSSEDNAVYF